MPDAEGTGCSICHCEFSLVRRRHHCRKCGALVCGECSDHFLPDRVCDTCELKESTSVVAERLDINDQIGASLKKSLKEKSDELELYREFLIHVGVPPEEFAIGRQLSDLCARVESLTAEYSNLRMDSTLMEAEIRATAQRCLRAESLARQAPVIEREIEQYALQIGSQQKLINQLEERTLRVEAEHVRGDLRVSRPSSPSVEEIRPVSANICQLTKRLLFG